MCSFHPWAGQLDLLGGCRAESIRTPGDREVVPELSRLVWSQPRPHWTGTPMAPVTLPPGTRNPPMAPVAPCSPTSHLTIPKPPCCNLPAPGQAIKCSINLPGGPDTSTIALKYIACQDVHGHPASENSKLCDTWSIPKFVFHCQTSNWSKRVVFHNNTSIGGEEAVRAGTYNHFEVFGQCFVKVEVPC